VVTRPTKKQDKSRCRERGTPSAFDWPLPDSTPRFQDACQDPGATAVWEPGLYPKTLDFSFSIRILRGPQTERRNAYIGFTEL
jgi:hypothetical protein